MGEFSEAAQVFARLMSERQGIRAKDIPHIVKDLFDGGNVNCYPGETTNHCYPVALFISLNSSKNAKGSGHLHFQKIVERLVQHMQGSCQGITQIAVIITDSWDARTLDEWNRNVKQIKVHAHLEFYFLTEGRVIELPI